jgi:excisionase family DNA binding protein
MRPVTNSSITPHFVGWRTLPRRLPYPGAGRGWWPSPDDFVVRSRQAFTVGEAASFLNVHATRVRQLIRSHVLEGHKRGDRWFIDPGSVYRRRAFVPPGGSPFTADNAWAILGLIGGVSPSRLGPWRTYRARATACRSTWWELAPRLSRRASLWRLGVPAEALARLRKDAELVRSGVSAIADHGLGLSPEGIVEGYVPRAHLRRIVRCHRMDPDPHANVLLHVVDGAWPFGASAGARGVVAPGAVVALDLIESGDPRSQSIGWSLLAALERTRKLIALSLPPLAAPR